MTEKELQSQVTQYLQIMENKGILFFHRCNNIAVYDAKIKGYRSLGVGVKRGFPDVIIIKNGKFIGIELKGTKGIVSKEQLQIQDDIKKKGGAESYIIRSLQELINILE